MKSIIFVLTLILCGCGNPYPTVKEGLILVEIGDGDNHYIDSIILVKDTLKVYHWTKDRVWYNSLMHLKDTILLNKFIGVDSVQVTAKDLRAQSITFKYDSIMIINFDSSEVK